MTITRCTAAALNAFVLSACMTVGPDYVPPDISTPDAWRETLVEQVSAGSEAPLQTWWQLFDDPKLDELIERTRQSNLQLQKAVSRVRQARAQLAFVRGEKLPAVDASGEYSRSRQSDDGVLEQVAPDDGFNAQNLYQIGIGASWELDVFGRIRRKVEAAGDEFQATVEDQRDVMVALFAETAGAYLELRGLQQRIVALQTNIALQQQSLKTAQERFDSGVSSQLDVAQARGQLAGTKSLLPGLELARQRVLNRLALLLGDNPGSLDAELAEPEPLPSSALDVSVGVPADVLRQRPDIRRAERTLAARTAQIGVATAALYPNFSLTGVVATQTRTVENLFSGDSSVIEFHAPVQWSLFNGGRVRSNIRISEERTNQALLTYREAVLKALEEVENALYAYDRDLASRNLLAEAVAASREAVDLVTVQYNTGLTDFNNVLTTQEALLAQQDQLIQSESRVVLDLVTLYRALGGGWDFQAATQ